MAGKSSRPIGSPTMKTATKGGANFGSPKISIPKGTPKSSNAHPPVKTQAPPRAGSGPKAAPKNTTALPPQHMGTAKADKDSTPGW